MECETCGEKMRTMPATKILFDWSIPFLKGGRLMALRDTDELECPNCIDTVIDRLNEATNEAYLQGKEDGFFEATP